MGAVNSKQIKIASRYAQALAKFDEHDLICTELEKVKEILTGSPDLVAFLESPTVTIKDKKDVVDKVFVGFSETILNFIYLLIDKGRFNYFDTILYELKVNLDEINNITRVEVVSAVELTEEEKNKLAEKLQQKLNKKIKADYQLDENIIAGLIIKIGDKVVDNSLKTRFEGLKRKLL